MDIALDRIESVDVTLAVALKLAIKLRRVPIHMHEQCLAQAQSLRRPSLLHRLRLHPCGGALLCECEALQTYLMVAWWPVQLLGRWMWLLRCVLCWKPALCLC